ncbi:MULTISPECIES: ATP-binding cassette domain-containing protein [unclassified Staphylococcus]|uniref:ATP-binding cassette domain-containing protein n=1 Tax=unclassified Staphylococcus TaxID=91994 RepID=UPI0021D2D291|nr:MULTISPECIES: ATP-binding cassette domain-containing protein [unclassified Staphylococcus]UXR77723.1 ATP-binding cassette domain-containing protein [Staphylococcus sp. IVB6227]UXR81878.1 ATP-binding cassette domain-containing protein [Staphylococcus sp. IVB6214]
MSNAIVLKMINVTHYYRNQKKQNVLKPFSYQPEDIELNNITLHIYQGEALGIIGEEASSKSLVGEILAGTVLPDKGRIVRKASLFYANMNQKLAEHVRVIDYINDVIQLYEFEVPEHKAIQVLKYAHLDAQKNDWIHDLTDEQYAQLMFSLARSSNAEVVILSHILSYLDQGFFEKAKEMVREYVEEGLTWVAIDNDVDKIKAVSNYIVWISHGQLRKEGYVKQVIPAFEQHMQDRLSITSQEALNHFDEDWKRNRSKMPEVTYNFKRIERYHHATPPVFLARIWTWTAIFIAGMFVSSLLIFNNLGKLDATQYISHNTLTDQPKHQYTEKLAYGIVNADQTTMTALHQKGADVKVPQHAIVTITGESKRSYRVTHNDKNYRIAKENVHYFNPAALYNPIERDALAPFMKDNYINYVDYFNGELHKSHGEVNEQLVPEKKNRYVEPILQQPIAMLFNDQNKLIGYRFPIVKEQELKEKYHIDEETWTAKTEAGYFIADFKTHQWIFIEL